MSESSKYLITLSHITVGLLVLIVLMLMWQMSRKKRCGYGCRCPECRFAMRSMMNE